MRNPTYDSIEVNAMDSTTYRITERFRSTSLSERKRNLHRQMEEYILAAIRHQADRCPPTPAEGPVAESGPAAYNTSE